MTKKRDLKKRIRDRQAKTGETYTTARRHVLAAREPDGEETQTETMTDRFDEALAREAEAKAAADADVGLADELKQIARGQPIQVDEVLDVSETARKLGLACKVLVYERLAKAVDPSHAIAAVRDALAATERDPTTALLRAVIAGHAAKLASRDVVQRDADFMARIAAGLTAVSKDGRMLAVHVNGHAGMVTIVCAAWRQSKTLIMTTPDDRLGPVLAGLGALANDKLFLIYEGRRYPMSREPFVIGRNSSCNLQIRDGHVSRKHAAIVQRLGAYYIIDLGSHAGLEYRGIKITNKRIEEGDMFKLHDYALRFTFHETDA